MTIDYSKALENKNVKYLDEIFTTHFKKQLGQQNINSNFDMRNLDDFVKKRKEYVELLQEPQNDQRKLNRMINNLNSYVGLILLNVDETKKKSFKKLVEEEAQSSSSVNYNEFKAAQKVLFETIPKMLGMNNALGKLAPEELKQEGEEKQISSNAENVLIRKPNKDPNKDPNKKKKIREDIKKRQKMLELLGLASKDEKDISEKVLDEAYQKYKEKNPNVSKDDSSTFELLKETYKKRREAKIKKSLELLGLESKMTEKKISRKDLKKAYKEKYDELDIVEEIYDQSDAASLYLSEDEVNRIEDDEKVKVLQEAFDTLRIFYHGETIEQSSDNTASFTIHKTDDKPESEPKPESNVHLRLSQLEAGDRAIQIGLEERSQTDTFRDSIKILEKRFAILANLPEDSELKEQYKNEFEQAKYNRDKYKGNITIYDEQTNTFVLKNRAQGDPIFQIKNEGAKVDIKSQNLDKDINMVKTLEALREVSGGRFITMYDCSDQETALKVLLYGRMMNLNVRISDEVAEKFNMGSEAFKKLAREISSCSSTQAREAIEEEKFNKSNLLGQKILESLKTSNVLSKNTKQLANKLEAIHKNSNRLSGATANKKLSGSDSKTVLQEETGQSKQVIAHQRKKEAQQEEEKRQNETEAQQVQEKSDENKEESILTITGRKLGS